MFTLSCSFIEGMPIQNAYLKWTLISHHLVLVWLRNKKNDFEREYITPWAFSSRSPFNCPTTYSVGSHIFCLSSLLGELHPVNPFWWLSHFCFSCAWISSDFAWRKCLSSDLCRQIPIGPIFSLILLLKRFVLPTVCMYINNSCYKRMKNFYPNSYLYGTQLFVYF